MMRIARQITGSVAVALLSVCCFHASTAEPDLASQMEQNRDLKLTGARVSEARSQHLIATFVDPHRSTNIVTVSFRTGRSTPHRRTVESIIRGAVDWDTPSSPYEWHKTKAEVIFSAPTNLVEGDFSGWYLVSLNLGKTK